MDENVMDSAYWQARYDSGQTGWDLGHANRGLVEYVVKNVPVDAKILIPGAGRAYEALALWKQGYFNTYVLDWAPGAFTELQAQVVQLDIEHKGVEFANRMLIADFFELRDSFDLILEQTFFCALPPSMRPFYVRQAAEVLHPHGKLVGVFFDREFSTAGPPFGGNLFEYQRLFSSHFAIQTMVPYDQSVAPRKGSELFAVMTCK